MKDKEILKVDGTITWGVDGTREKVELEVKYEGDYTPDEFMRDLAKKLPSGRFFVEEGESYEPLPDDDTYEPLPDAERVILSAPATVMLWADGTKTVSKARGGDEYDPLFGLLACIVRKLTRNKGHAVNDFEGMLRELAETIESPDDIDGLIGFCMMTLDILTVLKSSSDQWLPQLGDPQAEVEEDPQPMADGSVTISKCDDLAEEIAKTQDEIRQMVRNLTLDGEL